MYTALIEDHPEKRSRGKAVFIFPLVLLFILIGVASTRHLLNVNANSSLESMLANTPTSTSGTERTVGNSQCDHINDENKASACNDYYKKTVKCDICQDENAGAVDKSAINDAIRGCKAWYCLDICHDDENPNCKLVMTLDMGSSGVKPAIYAIQKSDNKMVPEIHLAATNEKPKKGKEFDSICGIWIDKKQYQGDKGSFCTTDSVVDVAKYSRKLKEKCFRNTEAECADRDKWTCSHLYEEKPLAFDPVKPKDEYASSASTKIYHQNWIQHFKNQMTCFLNKPLESNSDTKPVKEWITAIYGGVTAGLRNDPDIITKFAALEEGTDAAESGGEVWRHLKSESGKPVHIRMLSGEEEGYYEWLGHNWGSLTKFTNKEANKMKVQGNLKNIFTMGGASAQIAVVTSHPMNTLDNTFYFHIGEDKYWIYANSIMWGGSTRLTNMVEKYAKSLDPAFELRTYRMVDDPAKPKQNPVLVNQPLPKEGPAENKKPIMDNFFKDNDNLLCGDICQSPACGPDDRRLYKGICVMGFHFPTPTQWLTHQFVGLDYTPLTGSDGCLELKGSDGINLEISDEGKKCDDPTKYQDAGELKKLKRPKVWWNQKKPSVTLPFYGRFFKKLITSAADASVPFATKPELSKGESIGWEAIWATMWLHGRFQGFADRAAAETTAAEFRRNLGGLKGEYTLGPLTIPAHFGTPEDKQ